MIALMNSVLVGLAAALAVLAGRPALARGHRRGAGRRRPRSRLHLRVIRHRIAGSAARVGAVLTSRALAVADPESAGDRV